MCFIPNDIRVGEVFLSGDNFPRGQPFNPTRLFFCWLREVQSTRQANHSQTLSGLGSFYYKFVCILVCLFVGQEIEVGALNELGMWLPLSYILSPCLFFFVKYGNTEFGRYPYCTTIDIHFDFCSFISPFLIYVFLIYLIEMFLPSLFTQYKVSLTFQISIFFAFLR